MTCIDRRDLGLLLLRLGTGGVLAAHGSQKLLGWFGGGGIEGTGQFMDSIGYAPGKVSATAAGVAELGGGGWVAGARARHPGGGAAAAGAMAGASAVHTPNGFFNQEGGFEYAASLGLTAAGLAVAGPGGCRSTICSGMRSTGVDGAGGAGGDGGGCRARGGGEGAAAAEGSGGAAGGAVRVAGGCAGGGCAVPALLEGPAPVIAGAGRGG